MILVTGGAGVVGVNYILRHFRLSGGPLVNLDALTYAARPAALKSLEARDDYHFVKGDIRDAALLCDLFARFQPDAVIHMAAESHVDRSITGPALFFDVNVQGTVTLLTAAQNYWEKLSEEKRAAFRFLYVSTDEVYGSLNPGEAPFTEATPWRPNSPYSASKAAAGHAVRAWFETYGLPVLTTCSSNNYGPYQYPEKLIPLMIGRALAGKPLPVYGDGSNIRDWIYVEDHAAAIDAVLSRGRLGEVYNVGACHEVDNLTLVRLICRTLDALRPKASGSYAGQIRFVTDRPGHDRRYALTAEKIRRELGWRASADFAEAFKATVTWYAQRSGWFAAV